MPNIFARIFHRRNILDFFDDVDDDFEDIDYSDDIEIDEDDDLEELDDEIIIE
jgi:hypothetical protein